MDALPLDAGDYGGTYKLVGGRPALDFVNTVSFLGHAKAHDWLDGPTNVIRWAVAAFHFDEDVERDLANAYATHHVDALRRLRELRSDLREVIAPLAHGHRPSARAVERLNRRLATCSHQRRIDPSDLTWKSLPVRNVADLERLLIDDAAAIVTAADHTRLGHCPTCDWLYFDHTRNRSKRWCDMVDCGSRDKATRYYHRTRDSDGLRG